MGLAVGRRELGEEVGPDVVGSVVGELLGLSVGISEGACHMVTKSGFAVTGGGKSGDITYTFIGSLGGRRDSSPF